MKRIIFLLCLTGLAAIALELLESKSFNPVLSDAAPEAKSRVEAPMVAVEEQTPEPSPIELESPRIPVAILQLRLDSDKRDIDAAIDMLAGQDSHFVETVLRQIPDGELCGYLLNRLAIRWGTQNPPGTAAWLLSLPENIERTQALISMGRVWAAVAPDQAANYAVQFPAGWLRQQVLAATLSVWIHQDIEAASKWVLQCEPGPDFDPIAAEIARTPEVIAGDVRAALSWAESISNSEQRRQSIAIILAAWAGRDRQAASEYALNTLALTLVQREELTEELRLQ